MVLRIGPLVLDNPVFLAPMSGVTDAPFRRLARRMGCGLVYSEMIASRSLVGEHGDTLRRCAAEPEEQPFAVQIAGNEPAVMAEAARMIEGLGADLVDINMGCPVKKVVKGHAGSALMRDEALAARIAEAVARAVSVPVTVKMRLGWDDEARNAPRLARLCEEAGAQAITVHGRTRCQMYSGTADWRAIRAVRKAISVPVIGNGDVDGPESARIMLAQSGADGVMIGRAAQGRPWLPGRIAAALAGRPAPEPTLAARRAILLEHLEALVEHYGPHRGIRNARKHMAWAAHGLPGAPEFRAAINAAEDAGHMRRLIDGFFLRLNGAVAA